MKTIATEELVKKQYIHITVATVQKVLEIIPL